MKKENARIGMKVVIKDSATACIGDNIGDVLVIRVIGDKGVFCTPTGRPMAYQTYYYYDEVKRVKGHAYL